METDLMCVSGINEMSFDCTNRVGLLKTSDKAVDDSQWDAARSAIHATIVLIASGHISFHVRSNRRR